MLLPETIRPKRYESWLKSFICIVVVAALAAVLGVRMPDSLRGTDFPDFYCAARMLLDGRGHQLYDADLQGRYQARDGGRVGTLYIHPPFEAVLYLVVAWLPLRPAYVLWSVLNLILLAAALRRLAKQALPRWDWRILLAASLTFVPLLLCLVQGQDSALLLLLIILAFTDLRRDRATAAGCWLGLGLFKFQLVLPLVLVLALTQDRKRSRGLAEGFISIVVALAGLSAAISGWSVFRIYPDYLLHLQEHRFAGIFPQAMANFRGLMYVVFYRDHSAWAIAGMSILSAAALVKILFDWKHTRLVSSQNAAIEIQSDFDLAFANTVLFSLLVSYHSNPHDLSLLLLPISLALRRTLPGNPELLRSTNWIALGLLAILFLPPLHLLALRGHVYALMSIPVIVLFLSESTIARQE